MKKLLITIIILGGVITTYYSYLRASYNKALSGLDRLETIYGQGLEMATRLDQNTSDSAK